MKVHVLQHVPFEDIGSIESLLNERQADLSYTRFYKNDVLPQSDGLDLIIVMGGPMSVNDEASLSWLRPEKEFIRDAVRRGVPMIGICLGAQLIAGALGARIYRNVHKEIGWFNVTAASNERNCFRFPNQLMAFHWHGETFDLPQGAVRLARSEACENQAFQIGRHVIGLQFHLETTRESLRALINNCREELIPGPYLQSEQRLLQEASTSYVEINAIMIEVLSYVTGVIS
jgi:GMP synthase-like glutamine amidotransferase